MNWYDAAGNLIWTGPAIVDSAGDVPDSQSERRMYYGADGKLHATESRALYRMGPDGTAYYGFSRSFEEYRYDALGRRVVTKFDQSCDDNWEFSLYKGTCRISGIRRTVWDGTQEVGEIQVPNAGLENDTYVGQGSVGGSSRNLSPYYGAVAYVFDGQIDRPLSVTRLRYSNYTPANTIVEMPTFTYYPMWDVHGLADLGMFLPNPPPECPGTTKPGDKVTCVSYVAQLLWSPYRDVMHQQKAWHGSLLEDKVGTGGLMYRRNRYYDSRSGRFTEEDPIGLAGGLNLYGFAAGDPVNFSDPFGLKVCGRSRTMRKGIEDAANADIAWDGEGCVSSLDNVTFNGDPNEWGAVQAAFGVMVTSEDTYSVVEGSRDALSPFGCPGGHCSWFDQDSKVAHIFSGDYGPGGARYRRCGIAGVFGLKGTYDLGGLVAHELLGHGRYSGSIYASHSYSRLWQAENVYNRAHGRPTACPR
jgi:RHS repeat-associated protein